MSIPEFITASQSTAYLFPGQGSQEVGHGRRCRRPIFRQPGPSLKRRTICSASPSAASALTGPKKLLTDTINAQPALLTASIAILRAVESAVEHDSVATRAGITRLPTGVFLAGHSMGEYTALVAAGSISFADGLHLVRERGRLMKEAGERSPGMMAAVLGLDEAAVAAVCADVSSTGRHRPGGQ